MKKKNFKKRLLSLSLCLLVVVGAAAWLFDTSTATGTNNIRPGELSIVFDNQENKIELSENLAIPMTNKYANENLTPYTFDLINDGDLNLDYVVTISDLDSDFNDGDVIVNGLKAYNDTPLFYGQLDVGESVSYSVITHLDQSVELNNYTGNSASFKLKAYAVQREEIAPTNVIVEAENQDGDSIDVTVSEILNVARDRIINQIGKEFGANTALFKVFDIHSEDTFETATVKLQTQYPEDTMLAIFHQTNDEGWKVESVETVDDEGAIYVELNSFSPIALSPRIDLAYTTPGFYDEDFNLLYPWDDAFGNMLVNEYDDDLLEPGQLTTWDFFSEHLDEGIKHVVIPKNIEFIGSYVFDEYGIETVIIPENVPEIDYVAMYSVGKVVYFGDAYDEYEDGWYADSKVEYRIDGFVFDDPECTILYSYDGTEKDVVIPKTTKEVYYTAFSNIKLSGVVLPEGLEKIDYNAFANTGLQTLYVPSSVTEIGNFSFLGITAIFYDGPAELPGVTSPYGDIWGARYLNPTTDKGFIYVDEEKTIVGAYIGTETNITIPSNVTSIAEKAFNGNTTITSVIIPEGITKISNSAFYDCKNLKEVVLPSTLQIIDDYAFRNCTKLERIIIPKNVERIGLQAFCQCNNLTEIILETGSKLETIDESSFAYTKLTSFEAPEFLKTISSKAFSNAPISTLSVNPNNKYLDSRNNSNAIIETATNKLILATNTTVIPSSIEIIGPYAFDSHTIETINLPNELLSIEEHAFDNCKSLISIDIPDSVTYIGQYAFSNCRALESVKLSNNITKIEKSTFDSCEKLSSIVIPEGVTSIGDYAFRDCGLTSLSIPNSVITIGSGAFRSCESLVNLTLGSGVTSVGDYAFGSCTSISELNLPASLKTIGGSAFRNLDNIITLVIPDNVNSIGNNAFESCDKLQSATLSKNLKTTADMTFRSCHNLETIVLPEGLEIIGERVFSSCEKLSAFNIPSTVKSIGMYAISESTLLTSLTIPANVTSISWRTIPNNVKNVVFEDPTGWYIGSSAGQKTTALSSTDLANTTTAAKYLTSTYYSKYWTK